MYIMAQCNIKLKIKKKSMTWHNDCTGVHCYNTAGGGGGGSNANHAVTPHLMTGKPGNV